MKKIIDYLKKDLFLKICFLVCLILFLVLMVHPLNFNADGYTVNTNVEPNFKLQKNDVVTQKFKSNIDVANYFGFRLLVNASDKNAKLNVSLFDGTKEISNSILILSELDSESFVNIPLNNNSLIKGKEYTLQISYADYVDNNDISLYIGDIKNFGYILNSNQADKELQIYVKGINKATSSIWYPLMGMSCVGSLLCLDIVDGGNKHEKRNKK